jgi:soluble lytic murein transglycosylase-like protein
MAGSVQAGSISAYREGTGRVVFVNDPPTEAYLPKTVPEQPALAPSAAPSVAAPVAEIKEAQPAAPAPVLTATASVPPLPAPVPVIATTAKPKEARPNRSAFQSVWDEMIESAGKRHHVDPALIHAVIRVESNYNAFAVSPRGAKGLMQLIPATAKRFGVKNIFDPKANLDAGVRYLKYLIDMFGGDLRLSLAAYNAGENAVDRHSGVPPFPETQDYLRRISDIYPLSPGRGRVVASTMATPIGKYVDGNGVVHFSNTDMP